MENVEKELIRRLSLINPQLKRLYMEHERFEHFLSKFENRVFLTTSEEMEQKRLKIRKLRGVDEMMKILAQYSARELQDIDREQAA